MTRRDPWTGPSHVPAAPAADALAPLLEAFVVGAPVRIELWDGSTIGSDAVVGTIRLASPDALRRLV